MKTSAKHLVAVNKVNQTLGIAKQGTENKTENVVTQLYKSMALLACILRAALVFSLTKETALLKGFR